LMSSAIAATKASFSFKTFSLGIHKHLLQKYFIEMLIVLT
jgi:hypothetical protein